MNERINPPQNIIENLPRHRSSKSSIIFDLPNIPRESNSYTRYKLEMHSDDKLNYQIFIQQESDREKNEWLLAAKSEPLLDANIADAFFQSWIDKPE